MNQDLSTMTQAQLERHSQALTVSETSRQQAEIQASLAVAQGRPRNEMAAIDKLKRACERPRLAELAEYSFQRGGQDIGGASIRLLEVAAQAWGNLQYGFRELSQSNGESTVETFAWDLEANTKETRTFVVPHVRYTRNGSYPLKDPRDIYELVANQSQRRVRACLEHVIPRDIIEEAVDQCRITLAAKCDTGADAIKKLLGEFEGLGVSREQIEIRIQRKIDAIQPAQFLALRRVFNSIKDGMSSVSDWFESEDAEKEQTAKKSKLRGKGDAKPAETPPAAAQEPEQPKTEAKEEPKPKPKRKRRTKKEMEAARAAEAAEAEPMPEPTPTTAEAIEAREREELQPTRDSVDPLFGGEGAEEYEDVPDEPEQPGTDEVAPDWKATLEDAEAIINDSDDADLIQKVYEQVAGMAEVPVAKVKSLGLQLRAKLAELGQ